MKKIYIFFVTMLMAAGICAQPRESRGVLRSVRAAAPSKVNKAVITPSKNDLWWGYFNESDAESENYGGVGIGAKDDYEAAIYIPAGHPVVGKATIKAIRIWLGNYISKITGLKVWIATSLTNDASGAEVVQEVSLSTLTEGVNEIELETPFEVNNQAIYVGYTMNLNAQARAIMQGGEYDDNSFFIRCFENLSDWSLVDYFGKVALQVLLSGVSDFSAVPSEIGTIYLEKGGNTVVPLKITNTGRQSITSINYTITTDGLTSEEYNAPMNSIPFGSSGIVNVQLTAGDEARKYEKKLTVTRVCGMKNASEQNTSTGTLIAVSEILDAVPVVEEFTGTWCGWCPVGIEGMKKAELTFGNKAVLIAVHSDDVMETVDYAPIADKATGYPSSFINRAFSAYPSDYYLPRAINQWMGAIPVGKIDAWAEWTDDGKTAVSINTTTKFVYSDEDGRYGIAFVLVEDGLKGTDPGWEQTNNLSGNDDYNTYDFWYNSPQAVIGMTYDHVAVAAWEIENGIDGSVSPTVKDGESLKFNYKADISSNSLIQDKSKLKVVALLIDRGNGRIVNAAQTKIESARPYLPCDVNRDREVNISDIVAVINTMAGDNTFKDTADVNGDTAIDISDIVAIINYMADLL